MSEDNSTSAAPPREPPLEPVIPPEVSAPATPPIEDELPVVHVERLAVVFRPLDPPPQFGLIHLMLWVSGCAISLAAYRQLFEKAADTLSFTLHCLVSVIEGGALLALAVLGWRLWRGARWSLEPGHLLGAALCVEVVLVWIVLPIGDTTWKLQVPQVIYATLLGLMACSRRIQTRWRIAFGLLATLVAADIVVVLSTIEIGGPSDIIWATRINLARDWGIVVVLTAPAILDRSERTSRTWLHWLGWSITFAAHFLGGAAFLLI